MRPQQLQNAVDLASRAGPVYIATADTKGTPHIAVAAKIESSGENAIALTEWFCLATIANLQSNKSVSVVTWDSTDDVGYQILGRVEKIIDMDVLDGYAPEIEEKHPLPQTQRRLVISVEKIMEFRLGPHSDIEDSLIK